MRIPVYLLAATMTACAANSKSSPVVAPASPVDLGTPTAPAVPSEVTFAEVKVSSTLRPGIVIAVPIDPAEADASREEMPIVEQIKTVIQPAAKQCFNQALTKDITLGGHLEITFVIEPDGRVLKSATTRNEGLTDFVVDCVGMLPLHTRFVSPGRTHLPVTVPFNFVKPHLPDAPKAPVDGGMTFRGDAQRCYDTALAKDETSQGTLRIVAVVREGSRLSGAEIENKGDGIADALSDCVLAAVKNWKTGEPIGARVHVPFRFTPWVERNYQRAVSKSP